MANTSSKIYINGNEAENTLKGLTSLAEKLRNEMRKVELGTEAFASKAEDWRKVTSVINDQKNSLNEYVRAYGQITLPEKSLTSLRTKHQDIVKSLDELESGTDDWHKKLNELYDSEDNIARIQADMKRMPAIIKANEQSLDGLNEKHKDLVKTLHQLEHGTDEWTHQLKKVHESEKVIEKLTAEMKRTIPVIKANEQSLDGLNEKHKDLVKTLHQLETGTKEWNDQLKKVHASEKNIATFTDKIKGVEKGIPSLISNFKGIGVAAAAAFVVDKVLTYGYEINKLAIQVDTYNRKTKIVFGEASRTVEEGARQQAAEIGIARSEYQKLATEMGDLLVPMGYTRQEAASASVEVMHLAGALAEWSGGQYNVAETSKSLQKAMTGEYEELERYGVKLSAEIVKTRLAAEGKDKLTGRAMENAKAHAILAIMTEKSADALTAFAANEDSLARQNSRLKASFETIKETLVQKLLPIIERGTTALANMIAPQRTQVMLMEEDKVKMNDLTNTIKKGTLSRDTHKQAIEELNAVMTRYHIPNMLTEKSTIAEIEKAQIAANKAFENKILMMSMENILVEQNTNYMKVKSKQLKADVDLTVAQREASEFAGGNDVGKETDIIFAYQNNVDIAQQKVKELIDEENKWKDSMNETREIAKNLGYDLSKTLDIKQFTGSGKSGSDAPKDDKKDSALEAQKRQLEQLKENIKAYNYDIAQLQMTNDEKEQSRIKEKYEKQIETAKELIKSKYPKVKAEAEQLLSQLQGQLEQEVKDLILKQRILAEAEYSTLRAEIEAKVEEERTKRKDGEAKELFDYNEYLGTKSDNEMDELTRKYKLIYEYAQTHNLDLVSLEQAHLTKLAVLSDKNNKVKVDKEKKTQEQEIKAKYELEAAQINIMQEGVSALVEVVGKKSAIGKALFAFEQGLAIAKIYTHMQEELAIIRLVHAANPILSGLFQGIAYAKGIAGAIKVGSLAYKEIVLPQKAKGGYHNVIGQDDNRTYNAQYIGQRSTGMLPASPSLVIAGERGPEYFVDNETLSTPQGSWHVRALENIRQGRAGVLPQYADGGYTPSALPTQVPTNGTVLVATADLALLNSTLTQLVSILNNGLGVVIGYPQIADIGRGIERIKGL